MPVVARFTDPRAPFRFVAEVRRLYDVSGWSTLDVTPTELGVVVELEPPPWLADSLTDLAARFGGAVGMSPADVDRLRSVARGVRAERRLARRPGMDRERGEASRPEGTDTVRD
jgi:hypothetical protein